MFLFVCGVSISALYTYVILARKEGEQPKWNPTMYPFLYKGMIIVPISTRNAIHIHHWMVYLSILCVSPVIYIHPICIGFSCGLTFQGLTYQDRFDITCDNPYHNVKEL